LASEDILKMIKSSTPIRDIQPGDICYCIRTSKSKKPKPTEGVLYICRKIVDTKWGLKAVVIDINSQEVWCDIKNMILVKSEIINHIDKNLMSVFPSLLHKKILEECTPSIGEVIKKNSAGLEVLFTNGSKIFVSAKIIYPESIYYNARKGEIISINLPLWFAQKNNIVKE
jgi:hypothetical protein